AQAHGPEQRLMQMNSSLFRRRRLLNRIVMGACVAAAVFGIVWLLMIIATLLIKGLPAFSLEVFTERTRMGGGGLGNAILGSLIMTALATVIGSVIGVLAGTWLAEYGGRSRLAAVIRFINDVLLSAPSIIIGLFVYTLLVLPMGNFSGWAG